MWIATKEIDGIIESGARFINKPAIANLYPDHFRENNEDEKYAITGLTWEWYCYLMRKLNKNEHIDVDEDQWIEGYKEQQNKNS